MAKFRRSIVRIRKDRQRVTWINFRLPEDHDWPRWSTTHSDSHLGPLAELADCQKVWLGRRVDDVTHAALIILWKNVTAAHDFSQSAAGATFLHDLNLSTAQHATPPPLPSFHIDQGFDLAAHLHGRITLTVLRIPYADAAQRETLSRAPFEGLRGFMPAGTEDLRGPPANEKKAFLRRDDDGEVVDGGKRSITCYVLYRWNSYGASAEREEAAAKDVHAVGSWAEAVGRIVPAVEEWWQERWDVELAPSCREEREDEEVVEGEDGGDD